MSAQQLANRRASRLYWVNGNLTFPLPAMRKNGHSTVIIATPPGCDPRVAVPSLPAALIS